MSEPSEPSSTPRGPLGLLIRLFSSVWLGVFLLTCLFIYSSVGSAGVPFGEGALKPPFFLRPDAWISVRERLELTEFEWFHWWPFDLLIALICVNLVVATLRRIPLNVLNLGVWMIHSGIIILSLGSVWYFGTKLEGDTPVSRRVVVASLPGHEPVSFIASPGNVAEVGSGADRYTFQVQGITPDWELLSGDDAGDRAYKVSVLVQTPTERFIRELIAGYPQYTEDLVFSSDSGQPFQRAKKVSPDGDPLVDHELALGLEYDAQSYFYLMQSAAIMLREVAVDPISHDQHGVMGARHCPECNAHLDPAPTQPWVQRPIRKLPHFKDYVSAYDHVWTAAGEPAPPLRPLSIEVPPTEGGDPMPDVTFTVSEYLAYASMQTRQQAGGDRLNPWAAVELRTAEGRSERFEMLAFDPARNNVVGGALRFRWANTPEAIREGTETRAPAIHFAYPAASVEVSLPITATTGDDANAPFLPVEGTPFSYRVKSFQDGLVIAERSVSLAIVDLNDGERQFTRWIFDDPSLTRDLPEDGDMATHGVDSPLDDRLQTTYLPGATAGMQIVGGPGEDEIRMFVPTPVGALQEHVVAINEAVEIRPGITMAVTGFVPRSRTETRPQIIPFAQRDRDVGVQASMVRLNVPAAGEMESQWLGYHVYPFQNRQHVLRRFPYRPTVMHLGDGRHVEIMFSRERRPLPYPVALEDFQLETHIGGFSGQTSSILDWKSLVVFENEERWTESVDVHVNSPVEHGGYWYFQAKWDPPDSPRFEGDPGSRGLNYTVLGVGNRNGVIMQLAGCCIAVAGMIYAFYVKPYIKRRRRERVYATVRETATAGPLGSNGQSEHSAEHEAAGVEQEETT